MKKRITITIEDKLLKAIDTRRANVKRSTYIEAILFGTITVGSG